MKVKHVLLIVLAFLCIGCFSVGCSKKNSYSEIEKELDGFVLPVISTQEIGTEYTIPTITVFGKDNVECEVKVSVTCDGSEVTITDNKILLNSLNSYLLKYTVEYKGYVFEKQVEIKVTDTVLPVITIAQVTNKYALNVESELPHFDIFDFGGIKSKVVKVFDSENSEITVSSDNKFTPIISGKYKMEVTVTDNSDNVVIESTHFYVASAKSTYSVVEDFEEGMVNGFIKANQNNFNLVETENNNYANCTLTDGYPHIIFDKASFTGYMDKGYDKLHIEMWGTNEVSHTMYYEIAKNSYIYLELKAGQKNDIYISKANIDNILSSENPFEIIILNDNPNEIFDICIDNIEGVFTSNEALKQNEEADVSEILYNINSEHICESYSVIRNGEVEFEGSINDKFTPTYDGEYTILINLSNNLGKYKILCNVITDKSKISFEDGIPSAIGFEQANAKLSDENATDGEKSVKCEVGSNFGYPKILIHKSFLENVFLEYDVLLFDITLVGDNIHNSYYEISDNNYIYTSLPKNTVITISIKKDVIKRLSDNQFLEYVIINAVNDGNENFTFYIDNFRGSTEEKVAFYKNQQENLKLQVEEVVNVFLDGKSITDIVSIEESFLTINKENLVDLQEGLHNIIVTSTKQDLFCIVDIIGEKIGFENGVIPSAITFDGIEKTNVASDFPTDGNKTLHLVISNNSAYPTIHIDRKYLENVFYNSEYNVLSFDIRTYLANNSHSGYYEISKNVYDRFEIKKDTFTTINIKKEVLEYLQQENKNQLDIVLLNEIGVSNESFEAFIDNLHGENYVSNILVDFSSQSSEGVIKERDDNTLTAKQEIDGVTTLKYDISGNDGDGFIGFTNGLLSSKIVENSTGIMFRIYNNGNNNHRVVFNLKGSWQNIGVLKSKSWNNIYLSVNLLKSNIEEDFNIKDITLSFINAMGEGNEWFSVYISKIVLLSHDFDNVITSFDDLTNDDYILENQNNSITISPDPLKMAFDGNNALLMNVNINDGYAKLSLKSSYVLSKLPEDFESISLKVMHNGAKEHTLQFTSSDGSKGINFDGLKSWYLHYEITLTKAQLIELYGQDFRSQDLIITVMNYGDMNEAFSICLDYITCK